MRYYLNFTIAGLSLVGGVVAGVHALSSDGSWGLVVLAAVFFCFSIANLTLLEIRDALRDVAQRERIRDEAGVDTQPTILRVGPESPDAVTRHRSSNSHT